MEKTPQQYALARRYRPQRFNQLIGQDILRQTIQNAIKIDRVSNAYMLSGVRGVGKTTTARIIAKILNCTNINQQEVEPCLECENCKHIQQNSSMDVLEMDAASHTGVDDMRDIIESSHYKPTQGKYRIFILDEVHMLSKSAFNALLKTLEEPPPHVLFIFATTEIKKVPATILSRCQRFDLRRVHIHELAEHFVTISNKENYQLEDQASLMLARAADGSVRDGLSMLDQAMAIANDAIIHVDMIRVMLGQADKNTVWYIFRGILEGDEKAVFEHFHQLTNHGAEVLDIFEQLASITHMLSLKKMQKIPQDKFLETIPDHFEDIFPYVKLSVLARLWQFLSKAHHEIMLAHNPMMSAEMALIRLLLLGDYPMPEDFFHEKQQHIENMAEKKNLKKLPKKEILEITPAEESFVEEASAEEVSPEKLSTEERLPEEERSSFEESTQAIKPAENYFNNASDFVELARQNQDFVLASEIKNSVRLGMIDTSKKKILLNMTSDSSKNLIKQCEQLLEKIYHEKWQVEIDRTIDTLTLHEQKEKEKHIKEQKLYQDAGVKEILSFFPDAKIIMDKKN